MTPDKSLSILNVTTVTAVFGIRPVRQTMTATKSYFGRTNFKNLSQFFTMSTFQPEVFFSQNKFTVWSDWPQTSFPTVELGTMADLGAHVPHSRPNIFFFHFHAVVKKN